MNDRLLKTLHQETTDRPPVWLMRQAGRYLPEYRALRRQVPDFMTFCKNPELATQATLQPLNRFPLDAAIVFSDLLTIPDAMGISVRFIEGEGPVLASTIRTRQDIERLKDPEPQEDLAYVMTTLRWVKQALQSRSVVVPLIGFAGSPWTLATYLVEGQSSKQFSHIRALRYADPSLLHTLLLKLSQNIQRYLMAQIEAGADVLMVFDTWGGLLNPRDYLIFSLKYLKAIVKEIRLKFPEIPIMLFAKNGGQCIQEMAEVPLNAIGIDYTADLHQIAKNHPHLVLQGNLDPSLLLAEPAVVKAHALDLLENYPCPGKHIFNLGHGILPESRLDSVEALIETVCNYRYPARL